MLGSSLESKYMESAPFGLTETAATKIGKLLIDEAEPQNAFMRVAVDGGGCSGFQYEWGLKLQNPAVDWSDPIDGLLVIDPIAQIYVLGSEIDYVEELGGSYLTVKNPMSTSSCGCGESFGV